MPCYYSYVAKTSVKCAMVSEKQCRNVTLGLAKRSNAPQTGSQGPYIAYDQFRSLLSVSLKQAEIQKAGI